MQPPHLPQGDSPITRHTLLKMALAFLVAVLFLLEIGSPSNTGPALIVFFAMGLPSVIQLLAGFLSIFRSGFMDLTSKEKWVAISLACILVVPSLGGVWFMFWFVSLLLACYGHVGHCAPSSGIGYFLFLFPTVIIAWCSALISSEMSDYFSKRAWWPSPLKPNFRWLF